MRELADKESAGPVGETRLESRVVIATTPVLATVNGRYAVGPLLGQGGMAAVHQVTDITTGRQLALKQFTLPKDDKHYAESASLFEHEFLTLAQLSHPRIIEVYDYSVGEAGPYYTMELIDGGDLRERTPMSWRDACSVIYDVCSSLALIHSRRLVHRDVSPRNVRCGRDGKAKLIDFGALVPMGPGGLIVGTPQFVAPEVLHRMVLDARTDLYSLGATFYYTLTGRAPYSAKTFEQLLFAWDIKPEPPSRLVAGIPPALDALVLSLVSTDPASRPRSAFEVMQRLAVIAGLESVEPASVSRAYLSTPTMVGRDVLMSAIAREMKRAFLGRGRGVLIQAAAGLGRSRMIDAVALAAKATGALVLRGYGRGARSEGFEVARTLLDGLLEAAPDVAVAAAQAEGVADLLFETRRASSASGTISLKPAVKTFATSGTPRVELQNALSKLFLAMTRRTPLAIAVDDVHRSDEPSLAMLAALTSQAHKQRLLVVATTERDAKPNDAVAFDVLKNNSTRLSLGPLERADVERLFFSVFGDVPYVRLVSDGIHAIAQGNPRASMDVAQHLIDRGIIRYDSGGWTLPTRLDPSDLPASAEAALEARIAALSPLSRWFAQTQSLATHSAFVREDYAKLRPGHPAAEIDGALGELVSAQLMASDGRLYTIANDSVRTLFTSSLDVTETAERHQALVELYEGRLAFGVVRHALLGGLDARALDATASLLNDTPERSSALDVADIGSAEIAQTFELALTAAERTGRPEREINEIRRWLVSLSVIADHAYFMRAAPAWLERLKLDSGYSIWLKEKDGDAATRLSNAMSSAYGSYMQTPEAERVYRPDEAIKHLVRYVAMCIAVGSNRLDIGLVETLPELLEPFAPINELVDIVWQNAIAARDVMCRVRPERGRETWMKVYERLGSVAGAEEHYLALIRNAVAFGIGTIEAWMGMESATVWAERLDDDVLQQVSALQLRRTVRLQLGDWEGAERLRKEAEVLALQARSRQMFSNAIQVEINACALAGDITALKQCIDRARALADSAENWWPTVRLAEGRYQILCGDFEGALASIEQALDVLEPRELAPYPLSTAWCGAEASRAEALIGLERYEDAKAVAESALAWCEKLAIGVPSHDLIRTLALAEARLGAHDVAAERLTALIARQRELGITGLRLGANYEAQARVAIMAGDAEKTSEYMKLTAQQYRYGDGSALGARYERLLQEAYRAGGTRLPRLSEFESAGHSSKATSATVVVTEAMKGAGGATQRAERALDLLCDERAVAIGHLYLFDRRGVRLAASRGMAAPPSGLGEFVMKFLQAELDDSVAETRLVGITPSEQREVVQGHFIDARGVRYYPFMLRATLARQDRYAGLVVLAFEERPSAPDEGLVAAVSTHIIQSGDAAGVEYGAWVIGSGPG